MAPRVFLTESGEKTQAPSSGLGLPEAMGAAGSAQPLRAEQGPPQQSTVAPVAVDFF